MVARPSGFLLDTNVVAQFAATAMHHGLTFVTRNTADVGPTGVPTFNPWSDGV